LRSALLLLLAACGSKAPAYCGDGAIEGGEQCDDGRQNGVPGDPCSKQCRLSAELDAYVSWTIVGVQYPGFAETCGGVEAQTISITVDGPSPSTTSVACSNYQLKLADIKAGDYTVSAKLWGDMDAGTALTKGMAKTTFTIAAGQQPVMASMDFPYEDFVRTDYTGDFYFATRWGGSMTCAGATPPVASQELLLERGGTPLVDTNSLPLDGSTSACVDASSSTTELAKHLPWGPATMTITGLDASGTPRFTGTYQTFVGADLANPTLTFDVPSLVPDAGVPDAQPDATLADATTTDAAKKD
jgi:cysteine-rich repeat protein